MLWSQSPTTLSGSNQKQMFKFLNQTHSTVFTYRITVGKYLLSETVSGYLKIWLFLIWRWDRNRTSQLTMEAPLLHQKLPVELLRTILTEHCPPHTQVLSAFVCKYWKREVLGDKSLAELGRGAFLLGLCGVGDLHVLQWARSQGCPWTFEKGSVRAYNGELSWQTAQLLIPAADSKNYDLLRWLVEEGELGYYLDFAVSSLVISNIKGMDDLSPKEAFLWLREKMDDQGSWDEQAQCNACASAAGFGSLEVLKWLVEELKLLLDGTAVLAAMECGNIPALKWLLDAPTGEVIFVCMLCVVLCVVS